MNPNKRTQEERATQYFEKVKKIHNDIYDYSDSIYVDLQTHMNIRCKTCSTVFSQKPANHYYFSGCKTCTSKSRKDKQRKPIGKLLEQFKEIHGIHYDYSNVDYVNWETPIQIGCPIHGIFLQRPDVHLNGSGCKHCSHLKTSKHGVNTKQSTDEIILYVVEFTNEKYQFVKVGITSRSVKQRFSNVRYKPYDKNILLEVKLPSNQAIELESKTLIHFQPSRYFISEKNDGFKGCTEIFKCVEKDSILTYVKDQLGLHTDERVS